MSIDSGKPLRAAVWQRPVEIVETVFVPSTIEMDEIRVIPSSRAQPIDEIALNPVVARGPAGKDVRVEARPFRLQPGDSTQAVVGDQGEVALVEIGVFSSEVVCGIFR